MRVLVLDACQRAALSCVRSLGRAGYEVITGDEVAETLAGMSKYSSQSIVYPSPYTDPDAFIKWAQDSFSDLKLDVVLPVTEVTTDLVVRNCSDWPEIKVPFANIEIIDRISNKVELFKLAQSLGVPVPKSVVLDNGSMVADTDSIGFPGVLKPARSRILVNNEWKGTVVKKVESKEELERLAIELPDYYFPALFQEFVPGKGCGTFALYRESQQQAYFAHNRLREKPPEGGVSVLSESRLPDQELLTHSTKLLNAVGWEGVAMVEYRASEEQGAYLMEVNARFWGSLQLAIDAGVDFPALLLNELPSVPPVVRANYREGVKLRWLLGDLDRLYLLFKKRKQVGLFFFAAECARFCVTCLGPSKNETFRFSDPGPGLHELKHYFD